MQRFAGLVKNLPLAARVEGGGARVSKSYRGAVPILCALLGSAHLAQAGVPAHITEPGSGQRFAHQLKFESKNYTLVGTGLKKNQAAAVYAMALYTEDVARQSFVGVYERAGRRRAGLFLESRAQNFFTWGHFSKLGVLRYMSAANHDELQQGFREGLQDVLGAQAPAELRKDALSFIALFDSDLKEGQEIHIHTDDVGRLDVYIDGVKKPGPQNPRLCRRIWDIWLGFHPASKEMRQSLLERLEFLAK